MKTVLKVAGTVIALTTVATVIRANSVNKKIEINGKKINQLLGKSLLNDSRAIL